MKKTRLLYLGNDHRFFNKAVETIDAKLISMFDVITVSLKDKKRENLLKEIQKDISFDIVYIDFTHPEHVAKFLARQIKLLPHFKDAITVGLYGSQQEDVKEYVNSQKLTHINFIKSVEVEDLISHPLRIMNPNFMLSKKYAESKTQKMLSGSIDMSIISMSSKKITFETDIMLREGDTYKISNELFDKKVPYLGIKITKALDYSYSEVARKRFEAEILVSSKKKEEGQNDDAEAYIRTSIRKILNKEFGRSQDRRLKVLEVDASQRVLFGDKDLDMPCEYLSIPYFKNVESELLKRRPDVIHLSYQEGESSRDRRFNDFGLVGELCDLIKEHKLATKIVLWGQDQFNEEKLRYFFNFQGLEVIEQNITPKALSSHVHKLYKNLTKNEKKTTKKSTFYFDKDSRFQYGKMKINFILTRVSESFCAIVTKERVYNQVNIQTSLDDSGDMVSLLICPHFAGGQGLNSTFKHSNKCFIHSTDETKKKNLRMAVNDAISQNNREVYV